VPVWCQVLDEKEKFLVEEYTRNIPPPTRASSDNY
jgi:hypothetical protein